MDDRNDDGGHEHPRGVLAPFAETMAGFRVW